MPVRPIRLFAGAPTAWLPACTACCSSPLAQLWLLDQFPCGSAAPAQSHLQALQGRCTLHFCVRANWSPPLMSRRCLHRQCHRLSSSLQLHSLAAKRTQPMLVGGPGSVTGGIAIRPWQPVQPEDGGEASFGRSRSLVEQQQEGGEQAGRLTTLASAAADLVNPWGRSKPPAAPPPSPSPVPEAWLEVRLPVRPPACLLALAPV